MDSTIKHCFPTSLVQQMHEDNNKTFCDPKKSHKLIKAIDQYLQENGKIKPWNDLTANYTLD